VALLIFYANAVYFLRPAKVRIILLRGIFWRKAMITRIAVVTLTVLFAAIAVTGSARAGASASAPSKNSRSSQVAQQQNGHKTAKNEFGITEYSSSSAHHH
jgi:hypothetical protein